MRDDGITFKVLTERDASLLREPAEGVFDNATREELVREFLRSDRHHIVVAMDGNLVVGMASAIHYLHPDKAGQMFVNEVGVSPSHRGKGIGTGLLRAILERAADLGCTEAWVLTSPGNDAARELYRAAGGRECQEQVMFSFPLEATKEQ